MSSPARIESSGNHRIENNPRSGIIPADTYSPRQGIWPVALIVLLALYGSRAKPDAQKVKADEKPTAPISLVVPEAKPTTVPQLKVIPTPTSLALPKDTRQPIIPESRVTPSASDPLTDPRFLITYYPQIGESLIGLAQAEVAKELAKRDPNSEFGIELRLEEQRAAQQGRRPIQPKPSDPRLREYVAKFELNPEGANRVYRTFIEAVKFSNPGLTAGLRADEFVSTPFRGPEISTFIDGIYLPAYTTNAVISRRNNFGGSYARSTQEFQIPCPLWANGFNARAVERIRGFGYSGTSGGLVPGRADLGRPLYISIDKPNGTHAGTDIIECSDKTGRFIPQARVHHSIILVD